MKGLLERHPALLYLGLALALVLLYAQTVGFGIVGRDDPWLLRDNGLLQQPAWASVQAVFFDLSAATRYRLGAEYLPLRDLSVMLDFSLFGMRWGAHHAMNVLLYALACAILALALGRWLRDRALALAIATLWAVHPLHVESATWLSERKGLLAALFAFTCLAAFQRFCERGGVGRWLLVALTLLAALWSKGLALAFIGVLGLFAWILPVPGAPRRRSWLGLAALIPVAAAAFVPIWIAGSRLAMVGEQHGGGVGAAAAMMLQIHARYLWRALLGGPLGPVYDTPAGLTHPTLFALGLAAMLALSALAMSGLWRYRCPREVIDQKTGPPTQALLGLAAGLWLGMLLPVSQLLLPLQNAMADRYLLLPSLGVCVAAGALLWRIERIRLRWALIGALVISAALLSLLQTRSWSSDEALYRQALTAHPRHVPSMLALSRLASQRGQPLEAKRWLARATTIAPKSEAVLVRRAFAALRRGDRADAIRAFRRAASQPRADRARANLALLLSRQERHAEALRYAESAVKVRRLKAHNHFALGRVALAAGKLSRAARALRRAEELRPGDLRTQLALVELELRQGKRAPARERLERLLSRTPAARSDPRVRPLLPQLR